MAKRPHLFSILKTTPDEHWPQPLALTRAQMALIVIVAAAPAALFVGMMALAGAV